MILVGTLLLMLPISSDGGHWTSPVIALFVATSAVCVTGLVPVDTGTYWSGFGQVVILMMIQLGGLGFMAATTLLFLVFGWRLGLRERLLLSQSLDLPAMGGVVALVRRALVFTAALELTGFLILTLSFLRSEDLGHASWMGLFHSVSAFNNAGFDVTGGFRSLELHDDFITLGTVGALAIVGGIGFVVVEDLRRRGARGISVDSIVVLRMTVGLLGIAFLLFLTLEWGHALAGRTLPDKLLQSAFQAAMPRSAGFDSLPVGSMSDETQFFVLGLMFIGAGSGSTAGGIKVGTLAIVLAAALAAIAGRQHPEVAGRELRRTDIDRALALLILAVGFVFVATVVLARLQDADFFRLLFEATSAFGSVGLSTGVTPNLNDSALVLISGIMFIGRLGPLTLVLALVQKSARTSTRRLPEDRVLIG